MVKFHSENKLLLIAHKQKELRILGRVITNQDGKLFNQLIDVYQAHLLRAFKRPASIGAGMNVILMEMGFFLEATFT